MPASDAVDRERGVPWGYGPVVLGVIAGIFAGQLGLALAALIHGSAVTTAGGPLWGLALSSLFLQVVTGGVPLFVAGSNEPVWNVSNSTATAGEMPAKPMPPPALPSAAAPVASFCNTNVSP